MHSALSNAGYVKIFSDQKKKVNKFIEVKLSNCLPRTVQKLNDQRMRNIVK